MNSHGRELSFDERLAAEAAFSGRPFSPQWSEAARVVYDGIMHALGTAHVKAISLAIGTSDGALCPRGEPLAETGPEPETILPAGEGASLLESDAPFEGPGEDHALRLSRERAIEAGGLIEITPFAKNLGVPYVVGVTRPLWDTVVTASDSIPETAHESRLRDILMAFRLRLMSGPITKSVIDFPALLTFPPDSVPQPQLLLAAFHDSPTAPTCITLLLPRELSFLLHQDLD